MMYIVEHPELVLFFITFPFCGWVLQQNLSSKTITYIAYVCGVLLLPIFTGYQYIISNVYALLIYMLLTCGFSFMLKNALRKLSITIAFSAVLFPILGVAYFFGSMGGTINIEQTWKLDGYKVTYVRDQGFAGRPLLKYELFKYAPLPLFIKHVDTKVDNDTTNSCTVKFEYNNFVFDKCQ